MGKKIVLNTNFSDLLSEVESPFSAPLAKEETAPQEVTSSVELNNPVQIQEKENKSTHLTVPLNIKETTEVHTEVKLVQMVDHQKSVGSLDDPLLKAPSGRLEFKGSLSDIADIVSSALLSNSSRMSMNLLVDADALKKLKKIQAVFEPTIGKKSKMPVIHKIVLDYFWSQFGSDINSQLDRIQKAERKI